MSKASEVIAEVVAAYEAQDPTRGSGASPAAKESRRRMNAAIRELKRLAIARYT